MTDTQPTIPDEVDPSKMQTVTPYQLQLQVFHKTVEVADEIKSIRATIQTLSDTLAIHVKQNIDTFQKMNEYIGDQMSYRLFRERIEENDLQLELAKKEMQLDYLAKQYEALQQESKAEDEESRKLQLAYETQKLEIEHLKRTQEMIANVKRSTQDRMQSVKVQPTVNPLNQKIKETMILTGVGTLTAAAVGGVIAFIIFFVRFYIQNSP